MDISQEDLVDTCVLCKARQDSISNLNEQIFLSNTATGCGHQFCQTCVQREFYSKRQFACPKCRTIVSQSKLSAKSLEESQAEKDFAVRRKLKNLFNKTEADFASQKEFQDYEEMVEDHIYNLVHGVEVEETKAAIERYKQDNTRLIAINQMKVNQRLEDELSTIKHHEQEAEAQEREFRERLAIELQQKKDKKKAHMQMMLGEAAPQANESAAMSAGQVMSAAAAQQAVMPNTVLAFLNQRLPPAPVGDGSRKKPAVRTNEDMRKLHRAGGYDYSCCEARNWAQVRSELVNTR